ncbi:broad specificity phosphatase PhoE [Symbiobacterium terraclitae]|uniref:Broad specificity phosphatase PhoE n=1 Tax=Symbiobacterium terraclitae TaxID=557451 RepID=A0ABS4JVV9_9FIRM|nr:histidine phosphatase family protein [Symbiobacterium terraclitae]MBP2019644.1 broad specificity phosphatase PhoE [Symbiobacterium terraclitae]
MNRLYLVRHARPHMDPTRHHSEWSLDPAGEPELKQLASLPHWSAAYRIVSSEEPKAFQTAAYIAGFNHLPPPETVADLGELHKASFVPNHDEVMAALFRFPDRPAAEGWETAGAALARFVRAITALPEDARGRDLIVVSHGTVLSLYLSHLQGQGRVNPADWARIRMPDYCVVDTRSMRLVQPFGAW